MRIPTIETNDQRAAVGHAADACRIIRAVFPEAALVELAAAAASGVEAYAVMNVFKRGADNTPWKDPQVWLWSSFDHPNLAMLDEAARVQLMQLLSLAGGIDPNVFGPGELAAGAWELDIDAVLDVEFRNHVDELVDQLESSDLDEDHLADMVRDVAREVSPPAGQENREEVADKANAGGVRDQAQFLVERLGYVGAVNLLNN